MHRILLASALVLGLAAAAGSSTGSGAYHPLVIHAAARPPTLDGKLDEACWRQAERRPLRHYAGGQLPVGGSVALSYDEKNLYAAFWLDEPTPERIISAAAPRSLWAGEVVEWFICPSEDGLDYFHLAWNPAGRLYSAKSRSTGPGAFRADETWQPQWRTAAEIGAEGWTTEAVIPFAELGLEKPEDGTLWRINLNRHRVIEKGPPQWSALSPTGTSGFHQLERFADVYFGNYVAVTRAAIRRGGSLKALIGCWGPPYGYGAVFEPHVQLDRALGRDQVQIRTVFSEVMVGWPRRYDELAGFDLVVLTDVPSSSFSAGQLRDLRRYVLEGGALVLMGSMCGWRYNPTDNWWQSLLGELLPMQYTLSGRLAVRKIEPAIENHPLLRGLPLSTTALSVWSYLEKSATGAMVIATVDGAPFIAEKKVGQGRVVQIAGYYARNGTQMPISSLKGDFFMSAYYPLFWDHLVKYLTDQPVPHPAAPPVPAPKKVVAISCDVIRDNYGDLFSPEATLRLKPDIQGEVDYPYEVETFIEGAAAQLQSTGRYALEEGGELHFRLPYLDRGRYAMRLDLLKGGRLIDSAKAPFSVALPLLAKDEFPFSVLVAPDYLGATDQQRIAGQLKSIGFTGIFWLGGQTYGAYDGRYRMWNVSRTVASMQKAGLRTTPVWYATLLDIEDGRMRAGQIDPTSGRRIPSLAFPDKEYLPYAHSWLAALAKLYGRMPLTSGYASHDEIVGAHFAGDDSERFEKAFEQAAGLAASSREKTPVDAYRFMNYKLKTVASFVWFTRAVSQAYAPQLMVNSTISPMSMASHTSAVLDIYGTVSALGAAEPDIYAYDEPKLYIKSLGRLAILWAATEFGRLTRPDFMGGQLAMSYYEEFPEQVFAAISGGAQGFEVFSYGTTSFEKNGRQDERFAQIARRTTAAAGRIGRTLNHYRRSRARVAMLYPQTAHIWRSLGRDFNADYLKLVGTSKQYIGLGGAVVAQYDLLRRMFGQVDILFDEQIQRGDLRNYDVCVVGYARQVQARTLRSLRRFAEEGGTLLVSTDSAHLDETNQPSEILYQVLPATVGAARAVIADYTNVRMPDPTPYLRGNALQPKQGAEILFTFADKRPACVRGPVGRGQALVIGMPLAGLRAAVNESKMDLVSRLLNQRARLISRPTDGEFSAVTFQPKLGNGRIFMVVNHHKKAATTRVTAYGDPDEAHYTLADIVTGEKIPFTVQGDQLSFEITCRDRWGRALALLPAAPAAIEVSASAPRRAGGQLVIAVRLLGADGQLLRNTLPFDLVVTDPSGTVRDDLSGVRIADQGIYVLAMRWPINAKKGAWSARASEQISGATDEATWQVATKKGSTVR